MTTNMNTVDSDVQTIQKQKHTRTQTRVLQRIRNGGLSPHSFKLFTYYDYFSDWSVN